MSNITDLIITIFEDQIDAYYFTRRLCQEKCVSFFKKLDN